MSEEIFFSPENQSRRWLGYFDLLGTKRLLESGNYLRVYDVYSKAIEKVRKGTGNSNGIHQVSFSDSFVIYSNTDSAQDFAFIDQVARWFVYELILEKIPVRGALSCGDFYADNGNSLYFGQALVEAYEYGEAQEWVGFLLTPSAVLQSGKVGLPANERLNYAYWSIPYKMESAEKLEKQLPACILGRWITINGRNLCADSLSEMLSKETAQRHILKYENALKFISENVREPSHNLYLDTQHSSQ